MLQLYDFRGERMIKVVGACLILFGCVFAGVYLSSSLSVRVRVLNSFLQSFDIMKAEICGKLTPLEDVIEYLSRVTSAPLCVFYQNCFDKMKENRDVPFRIIWNKELRRSEFLRLKKYEVDKIVELGNILGRYGAEEQNIAIGHMSRCIESMILSVEKELGQFGKLYLKLGIICGIALVIVFA